MNRYFLIITALFFTLPGSIQAQSGNSGEPYHIQLPDTLPPVYEVLASLHSDPGRAEQIMESYLSMAAEQRRKFYPDAIVDLIHARYLYAIGDYRKSIEVNETLLNNRFVTDSDSLRMSVLDKLMESSRMVNDFDNTMKYALRMLDIAKEVDDKSQMGRAYLFMGKTQFRTGDKAQSLRYFELAEENFKAGNNLQWLSHFYLTMANLYIEFEDYQRSYDYALLYENSLDDLEKYDESVDTGTIDKYRGRVYIIMTEALFHLGRKTEAARYYDKFRKSPSAADPREGLFIVQYLMDAERYREAEPYVLRYEESVRQSGDTINDNMLNAKRYLQYIHYNLDNLPLSYEYLFQRLIITNNLRRSENRNSAIEIAAIYETAEREATIAAQKEKIRIGKIYTLTGFITAGLLLGLFVVIFLYNRTLSRKNRALVSQIRREHENKTGLAARTLNAKDSPARKNTDSDLFRDLSLLMETRQLYLNKGLIRDEVVELLGTNKNYLIEAIQKNTGMNFTDYVNSLRLEHSLHLLTSTDGIISAVAQQSGFGSVSSYHRLFTEKYGVSPNTYRKLAKSKVVRARETNLSDNTLTMD